MAIDGVGGGGVNNGEMAELVDAGPLGDNPKPTTKPGLAGSSPALSTSYASVAE